MYLERYPEGPNQQELGWQLTQVLIMDRAFEEAAALVHELLEQNPDHIFADRMLFLSGYALFQAEAFAEAEEIFTRLIAEYPESESEEAAHFWRAMTYLYRGQYEPAYAAFGEFARRYETGPFHVDAKFRQGVCLYALERFEEAREALEGFVGNFPAAPQQGEARLLLGDIAGFYGRLEEALEYFLAVQTLTIDMGIINHAAMQAGQVYEALERWEEMKEWFEDYLERYGTGGLYTEAIHRIGFALQQMDESEAMLDYYLEAVRKYGNDRDAIGIDFILRDWPLEYARVRGEYPVAVVEAEIKKTNPGEQPALALRWKMTLDDIRALQAEAAGVARAPGAEPDEEALEHASAAVLNWLALSALEQEQTEFAVRAFEKCLSRYPETEWSEAALLNLARLAAAGERVEEAVAYYGRLREWFPLSNSAVEALEEEAGLLAANGEYDAAVELLEQILEVNEWRGEPWARALYRIGALRLAQNRPEEAFAYFQRVYVLYSHYREWTAKSYWQSARCLELLGRRQDRINTLREMVGDAGLAEFEEYALAQAALAEAGLTVEQTP